MYEELIQRLENAAGGSEGIKMAHEAAAAIAALQAENAELREENGCLQHNVAAMQATLDQQAKNCEVLLAEKDREIERLKSALLESREDYMASEMEREQGVAALSRVEAERDASMARQKELDNALRDMVCQYCSHNRKLDHEFMSAGEHAFDVLDLDYGAPVETLWRGAQGEG